MTALPSPQDGSGLLNLCWIRLAGANHVRKDSISNADDVGWGRTQFARQLIHLGFCLSNGCLERSGVTGIDADRAIVICQRFASSLLRSDGIGVDAAKECFLLECFSALEIGRASCRERVCQYG